MLEYVYYFNYLNNIESLVCFKFVNLLFKGFLFESIMSLTSLVPSILLILKSCKLESVCKLLSKLVNVFVDYIYCVKN
jgi:hypothetical protein